MQAVRFTLKEKKLELIKIPIPTIKNPGDVLVKVAFAGVCGTDLHIMQGEYPCFADGPLTLGHEISGVVTEVGSQVLLLQKGDKVAVNPNRGCGICAHCHSANPHYCSTQGSVPGMNNTIGIFKDGGWAEFVIASESQVHKLASVSLEQGVLAEPYSCVAHAWDRISPITVGQKILITGAGIIGNLWAAVLHMQGHRNVTVSEPNATRRGLVEKLGTGFDIVTPGELQKNSKDPAYLFDLVIDCSGFAPAVEQAISLLIPGGKLCIFGVTPPSHKINIAPYDIYDKEITIVGVKINPYTFCKSLGLLQSLGERYLNYEALGVRNFPLRDFKAALDTLKKGEIAKAVFKF